MVGGMEPRVFDFSKKEKQVEVGIIKILPQKWKTWNSGLIIKRKKKKLGCPIFVNIQILIEPLK